MRNVAWSFLIKGCALVVSLLTVPAYLKYFEDRQALGLWFTLLSVLSWVLNFDLGLGNGLRNLLTDSVATGDTVKTRGYISSAYGVIGGLVFIMAIGVWFGFPFVNWNSVFNIPSELVENDSLARVAMITIGGILLQFALRLVSSILYALQRAAVVGLLGLISNIGILIFVSSAESGSIMHNLTTLAVAYAIAVNVPLFVASALVFATRLRDCAPSPRFFDRTYAGDVLRLGGAFFYIQIMYMLIANTDPFLISWLADPKYVVDHQIYSRPFNLVSSLVSLALTPVWSAVTKAIAERDYGWVTRLYRRLKRLALIAMSALIGSSFLLPWFIDFWLQEEAIAVDWLYALVFALSAGAFLWNGVVSSFVNGMGRLRIQAVLLGVGVCLKFGISFAMVEQAGWIWVVAANAIALLPYCIVQPIWISKYLRELREQL